MWDSPRKTPKMIVTIATNHVSHWSAAVKVVSMRVTILTMRSSPWIRLYVVIMAPPVRVTILTMICATFLGHPLTADPFLSGRGFCDSGRDPAVSCRGVRRSTLGRGRRDSIRHPLRTRFRFSEEATAMSSRTPSPSRRTCPMPVVWKSELAPSRNRSTGVRQLF